MGELEYVLSTTTNGRYAYNDGFLAELFTYVFMEAKKTLFFGFAEKHPKKCIWNSGVTKLLSFCQNPEMCLKRTIGDL